MSDYKVVDSSGNTVCTISINEGGSAEIRDYLMVIFNISLIIATIVLFFTCPIIFINVHIKGNENFFIGLLEGIPVIFSWLVSIFIIYIFVRKNIIEYKIKNSSNPKYKRIKEIIKEKEKEYQKKQNNADDNKDNLKTPIIDPMYNYVLVETGNFLINLLIKIRIGLMIILGFILLYQLLPFVPVLDEGFLTLMFGPFSSYVFILGILETIYHVKKEQLKKSAYFFPILEILISIVAMTVFMLIYSPIFELAHSNFSGDSLMSIALLLSMQLSHHLLMIRPTKEEFPFKEYKKNKVK